MIAPTSKTTGFDQLHKQVQRWIHAQGWPGLRPIQDAAVPPILSRKSDVIITAATAGGKTEAAFLPVFSQLVTHPGKSIQVIGLSPLKALINDQHRRLAEIGEGLNIPVNAWHGDIASGKKKRVLENPAGVVLITPESLEALFVLRGTQLAELFKDLQYIVIDEMHSFIGSERGRQMQSLMHRVELVVGKRVMRVGLSATLGDMSLAAEFLRPGHGDGVQLIQSGGKDQDIKLQIRGYVKPAFEDDDDVDEVLKDEMDLQPSADAIAIAGDLFTALRGDKNLIFINSRRQVERYADLLRYMSIERRVPNEFLPHHGSLAKELRQEAEDALKAEDRPSNVICTMTLEMGIDVGSVKSIAQVGPPSSVASTCQRLGRSGRRAGESAIMRVYISEPEVTPSTPITNSLYFDLVQAIAIFTLLLEGWFEPPIIGRLQLSTLIQQLLSLIAQQSGVRPDQAWDFLCRTGPFAAVDQDIFMELLRTLGHHDLIQQSQDGLLLLGIKGEKQVNHYTFYTAFATQDEYHLVSDGRTLGSLPVRSPLVEGMFLIFAGRRWEVMSVDEHRGKVEVIGASSGKAPDFGGSSGFVHDRLRQTMYKIYLSDQIPGFLDETARDLLQTARQQFRSYGLHQTQALEDGRSTLLFPWRGSVITNTLFVQLLDRGLKVQNQGVTLKVNGLDGEGLRSHLLDLLNQGPADPVELAAAVKNKRNDKYDRFLSDDLLCRNYAASHLDAQGAWNVLEELLESI
ncbi:MAG: DEAD/DEAH box helicase [Cyanobacteria bacterium P01_A01_bin.17]